MRLSKFKKVKDGTRTKPSRMCENNGGCPYCENNRLHKNKKQLTLNQEVELSEKDLLCFTANEVLHKEVRVRFP